MDRLVGEYKLPLGFGENALPDEMTRSDTGRTFDMSVVMQISDHIVVLDYGVKISDGKPSEVRNDPKVIAAYLGVADEEVEHVEAEARE